MKNIIYGITGSILISIGAVINVNSKFYIGIPIHAILIAFGLAIIGKSDLCTKSDGGSDGN